MSGDTPNAPSTTTRSNGARSAAPLSREPSTTTTFARPLSSVRAAAAAPESDFSITTFAPMASRSGRAIAGSAPDIERPIAGNDRCRLQHPRKRHRRQQLALGPAARRQFTVEVGERFKFRSDEALAGRCKDAASRDLSTIPPVRSWPLTMCRRRSSIVSAEMFAPLAH